MSPTRSSFVTTLAIVDIDILVAPGASDPATVIPVTVFHGVSAGPVLALTAGVHGYEYPPMLAGQQLLTRIDAARLSGTVILVRLAHVAAFEQRVPYVNPFDRKNLNRVFPGRPMARRPSALPGPSPPK